VSTDVKKILNVHDTQQDATHKIVTKLHSGFVLAYETTAIQKKNVRQKT
jgi:hypothetical protein